MIVFSNIQNIEETWTISKNAKNSFWNFDVPVRIELYTSDKSVQDGCVPIQKWSQNQDSSNPRGDNWFLRPPNSLASRYARLGKMATHRKQLDEYCTEVTSDACCRHKVMYGNSKNVIAMSQSAILHPLVAERELTRTLNPAVAQC